MIDPTKIKKIGIISVSNIGDIIITIPLLKSARNIFPESKIYLIAGDYIGLKLLEKCPYIDGIISQSSNTSIWNKIKFLFKLRREKFDIILTPWGFNLAFLISLLSGAKYRVGFVENRYYYNKKIALGKWLSNIKVDYKYSRYLTDKKNKQYDAIKYIQEILRPFGKIDKFNYQLEIFIDYQKEQKFIDNIFKKNKISPKDKIICIHLGGMKENEDRCRERKKRIEVLQFILKNYNEKIFFIGGEDNKDEVEKIILKLGKNKGIINMTGKLSLSQSTYIIDKCSLFLCTDSGPMNIGMALQKKVIALLSEITPAIDKYLYYPIRKQKISDIKIEEVISAIKKSL